MRAGLANKVNRNIREIREFKAGSKELLGPVHKN